jgi:hypothetical protein
MHQTYQRLLKQPERADATLSVLTKKRFGFVRGAQQLGRPAIPR